MKDQLLVVGRLLSFDLEITKDNKRLTHMGAVLINANEAEQVIEVRSDTARAISELNNLAKSADFVLGHNIIVHDMPWLKSNSQQHDLNLFNLPVIDTLFLSPLAFPKNPYHRLVKDYKLVKDSYNNPIADSRLALSIFSDQLAAFHQQYTSSPELIELYLLLFSKSVETQGLAKVFDLVITDHSGLSAEVLIEVVVGKKACRYQLVKLTNDFNESHIEGICLAYAIAWLQVSDGNSILPPWVWRKYPVVKTIIRRLRDENCGNENCEYCKDNFDAKLYLNRFFELPDFRPLPDGTPLQKQIVDAGINGEPSLGILPTGGGKSLCFQLPSLVRNLRNGSLTVVISPLQALMKDQVDNLKNKVGITNVAAVYGMLTMIERMSILDQVRMGDIAILYISPEQLRNKNVKQTILSRQIGAWVFDEAHCLSKWGHDFRPDYLYCAKVIANIAKEQLEAPPPVFCFTATAKLDVIEDIVTHFKQMLGFDLKKFEGGIERDNLLYEVVETQAHNKESQVFQLLEDYFGNEKSGSCVIYCSSRKRVEQLAGVLEHGQKLPVAYFHAGLESSVKREVLEKFIAGEYRVIVATNAFGMGIDKDDVRLVVHFDIPGSLENYLQEAGRAGRDCNNANCILLFDSKDIEQQFKLTKQSEVRLKDITELLKEIRYRAKYTEGKVVATSKELLRSNINTSIDIEDQMADTKVKTAIAWLEREGFVSREDNVNSVFQGKPLFATLEDAKEKISGLQLSAPAQRRWELILEALINADVDGGINADDILDSVIPHIKSEKDKEGLTPETIIKTLAQMADCGLVSKGFGMTGFLIPKGKDNCRLLFEKITEIENKVLHYLPAIAPDAQLENFQYVDLRALNTEMQKELDVKCSPALLLQLFKAWSDDGKTSGQHGSIDYKTYSKDLLIVQVKRSWRDIKKIAEQRQVFTLKTVDCLYKCISEVNRDMQKKVMVEFCLEEMMSSLQQDMEIFAQLASKNRTEKQDFLLKGIHRALLFLESHKSIELQNGMAVFKQAMEIHVPLENKDRYQKANYQQLDDHYHQKVVQVHVMYEYARLGLEHTGAAMQLVKDYFSEVHDSFLGKYFSKQKAMLDRATSQESWKEIVTNLNNVAQQAIVHAKPSENQLILAGPGAGKTKVIIHRIAYLMRVEQVPSDQILVLTFNHNSAVSLHKRLVALVGKDAYFIKVHTFHGLALKLLGQNFEPEFLEARGFDGLIQDAIKLLKGEVIELGLDEYHQRSATLNGIEHILVDEYQDIDQLQYDFIAALAGKTLEDDDKLTLMAVGDDDQSIYAFRDANVKFIRQFKDDYKANIRYLTQNYRSTKYIIEASNSLIAHNKDRMKTDHPIVINQNREMENAGGKMPMLDPLNQGKVKIIHCQQVEQQANEVLLQILAIRQMDREAQFSDIAIIARHGIEKPELALIRGLFHEHKIPYQYARGKDDSFSLYAVREFIEFKEKLLGKANAMISTIEMLEWLPVVKNYWHLQLEKLITDWEAQFGQQPMIVNHFDRLWNEYLFEHKRQTRYGNGVLLSTVHGVKGEEYKYVIVLGGNWQSVDARDSNHEEERRLYYVAMTRAIDQLMLFSFPNQLNPHITSIDKQFVVDSYSAAEVKCSQILNFSTTGLSRLYLSYASKFIQGHSVHQELKRLAAGDDVQMAVSASGVSLFSNNVEVAKISKGFTEEFTKIASKNYEAKVVAMVRRQHDSESEYEKNAQVAEWFLPVVEVVYW